MRHKIAFAFASLLVLGANALPMPVIAQPPALDPAPQALEMNEADWQGVITGQIEAFRKKDAAKALSFAAAGFKQTYSDPDRFYSDILHGGYEAMVLSRSHSFGQWTRLSDSLVTQIVHVVGPDQRLYEAFYQLMREPEGWRVQGVALMQQEGLAI